MTFLKIIGFFLVLLAQGLSAQEVNKRPNIIFIVADDMASWALGGNQFPNSYTPHLDKMGHSGAILENSFSNSPICSPSRATLISGRYPSENGVSNLIGQNKPGGLDTELKTFPELLKSAGYTTFLVGKWHLGEVLPAHLPINRGYDYFTGFPHGGLQSKSPKIQVEGKWEIAHGSYTPDLLTNYAMKYILDNNPNKTGKPFLLSLHFWAPHANTDFPLGMEPDYEGRSWLPMREIDKARWDTMEVKLLAPHALNLDIELNKRMAKEYYSSVHSVDRNVGRLLEFLEGLSLSDNTIVIFTSDHGYMMGQHSLWHKGNGWWLTLDGKDPSGIYGKTRYNLFDHSLKVPTVVRWPGIIKPGTVVKETIGLIDWFPTILEIAKIKPPKDLTIRGESFLPLLQGNNKIWNNAHYAEYEMLRSYRTKEWKLVLDFSPKGLHEFYDIKNDEGEHVNLYSNRTPKIINEIGELQKRLIFKMKKIDDPLLDTYKDPYLLGE